MKSPTTSLVLVLAALGAGACGPTTGQPAPSVVVNPPPVDTDAGAASTDTGPATVNCGASLTNCNGTCVDLLTDRAHCGTCANSVCQTGTTCVAGACRVQTTPPVCGAGLGNCDGNDSNGCETSTASNTAHCGACNRACTAGQACQGGTCTNVCGQTTCAGVCVDTHTDNANCGVCGRVCGAGTTCTNSVCLPNACGAGLGNCDGNPANGCETDLTANRSNCGACGRVCALANATAFCAASTCQVSACLTGFADCDGNDANGCEVNVLGNSNANCGACGRTCASGTACQSGVCRSTCTGTQTFCSGACCDTQTDNANCGFCGRACTGGTICTGGQCLAPTPTCGADQRMCNGICRNILTDTQFCGSCGTICWPGDSCQAGRCVAGITCPSSFNNCAGTCSNPLSDNANCGACGRVCSTGTTCQSGVCRTSGSSCELRPLSITLPPSFHSLAGCPEGLETVVHGVAGVTVTPGPGVTTEIAYGVPRYHSAPRQAATFLNTWGWADGGYIVFSGYCRSRNAWIEAYSMNFWAPYSSAGQPGGVVVWYTTDNASYSATIGPRPYSEGPQPATIVPPMRCR